MSEKVRTSGEPFPRFLAELERRKIISGVLRGPWSIIFVRIRDRIESAPSLSHNDDARLLEFLPPSLPFFFLPLSLPSNRRARGGTYVIEWMIACKLPDISRDISSVFGEESYYDCNLVVPTIAAAEGKAGEQARPRFMEL